MDEEMQPDFDHEPGVDGGRAVRADAERRLPEPLPSELALPDRSSDPAAATSSGSDIRAFVAAAAVAEVVWLSAIAYALLRLLS